jgi:hypothetical protein
MESATYPTIVAALVAGVVSVIVAVFSYRTTARTVRAERQKLERELTRRLTERLYELRLKHYPPAFEITERLGMYSGQPQESLPLAHQEAYRSLQEWKAAEVSLSISKHSLMRFYKLLDVLRRNPERENKYSDVQPKKTSGTPGICFAARFVRISACYMKKSRKTRRDANRELSAARGRKGER